MTDRVISLRDRLLAAAVVFGGTGDVAEIDYRISAYRALLKCVRDAEDGTIDEFDLISKLEDLPGFKSRQELRQLANDLGLLSRGDDGTIRLKERLFLDDYRAGPYPFAAPASVPVDFLEEKVEEAGGFGEYLKLDVVTTLRQTAQGLKTLLNTAKATKDRSLLSTFYRLLGSSEGQKVTFEGVGTGQATTPFLDIVLHLNDISRLKDEEIEKTNSETWSEIAIWAKRLTKALLPNDDPFGDGGALFVNGDDDYPGAERPSPFSNAEMLSAIFILSARFSDGEFADCQKDLLDFVLSCQNDDGGWGAYRYRSNLFVGKPQVAQSLPFFSFIAFVGLVSAFFDGDGSATDRIVDALFRYTDLLVRSAQEVGDEAGWSTSFDAGEPIDLYDTAINLRGCLLASKILGRRDGAGQDRAVTLGKLAVKATRYVVRHWRVSSAARANVQRISFRVPTNSGSSGTPMMWEQPADARVLRALAEASLAGINPGIDGYVKMAQAATEIANASVQGVWLDLETSNRQNRIININVTITSATGLLFFECARRALFVSEDEST